MRLDLTDVAVLKEPWSMLQLTADESRVLGVLVEKSLTTPDQYPLTLNAVVNGSNQKNNRDPVISMDDGRAFDALEALRSKGLVARVDTVGSRTNKYKHNAGDVLRVRTGELVVLTELLLRGPQTLGELRGRASRMHPLASLEEVKGLLRALSERGEPLVHEIAPSPGSRAERYEQLLCPESRHVEDSADDEVEPSSNAAEPPVISATPGIADRVAKLEAEVAGLKEALSRLAASVGEPDPFEDATPPSGNG
jgi:uncharacterized protein YceH (UPF0502 family)